MSQDTPPTEEVLLLSFDSVDCDDRLRITNDKKVAEIAASMREREASTPGQGQIAPIKVRRMDGGRYRVVAGAHRLEAAKAASLAYIKATLFSGDDDDARLEEIDENLFRHELSAFDQANFLEERRQIWERKNGRIGPGGDHRSKVKIRPLVEEVEKKGFYAATAERFGLAQTTIKVALARKARIHPTVWMALQKTEAATNGALLDRIARLSEDKQNDIISIAKERGCAVREAVRLVIKGDDRQSDAHTPDAVLIKFKRYWAKLDADSRHAIASFIAGETRQSKSRR
jgi:ParB family chromosome partitioning protein